MEVDDARATGLQALQQGSQFRGPTDQTFGGLTSQVVANTRH
jgi:hypothetical protein